MQRRKRIVPQATIKRWREPQPIDPRPLKATIAELVIAKQMVRAEAGHAP